LAGLVPAGNAARISEAVNPEGVGVTLSVPLKYNKGVTPISQCFLYFVWPKPYYIRRILHYIPKKDRSGENGDKMEVVKEGGVIPLGARYIG
jgi:hypothetical protein